MAYNPHIILTIGDPILCPKEKKNATKDVALSSCPMVYSSLDKDPSSCWVYQGDVGPVEWTVNACKADIVFPQRKVHLIQNMLLVFIMVIFPCQTVPMQLLFDNLGIILSQHVGHTKFL